MNVAASVVIIYIFIEGCGKLFLAKIDYYQAIFVS
jgi:hypothetical protein